MLKLNSWAVVLLAMIAANSALADEAPPQELVKEVVAAAGGEDKLLKLFRIKEQLNVSSNPEAKGNVRVSILEPPKHWWVGKKERVSQEKEPATFLVWAWTLGALTDPSSKLEAIVDVTENDQPAVGVRISGTITPPLDMYFDRAEHRLVRIDWRSDIHRFSDWKAADGANYPAKVVGYKEASGKPWYFSAILKLERLQELPPELMRP